jgi:hypothetical protein
MVLHWFRRLFVTFAVRCVISKQHICATHKNLGREGCAQPYFRQPEIEAATLRFLQALMIPGLAEAVDAAIASYAGQERKSSRQTRRRSIDERLKRLADLFELGDLTKTEYLARKNELLIERNQLEAQPAAASIALQRQQLQSVVDDWSLMTDEEKKRVLQLIFSEIGADHTVDGLKIEFRPRPAWEPYVEAVLARQRQEQDTLTPVTTSERKTGFEPATPSLARTCATAAPLPRDPAKTRLYRQRPRLRGCARLKRSSSDGVINQLQPMRSPRSRPARSQRRTSSGCRSSFSAT